MSETGKTMMGGAGGSCGKTELKQHREIFQITIQSCQVASHHFKSAKKLLQELIYT